MWFLNWKLSPITLGLKEKQIGNALYHLWTHVDFYLGLLRAEQPDEPPYYQWLRPSYQDSKQNETLKKLIDVFKKALNDTARYQFLQCLIWHPRSMEQGHLGGIHMFLHKNPMFLKAILKNQHNSGIKEWYQYCATPVAQEKRAQRLENTAIKQVYLLSTSYHHMARQIRGTFKNYRFEWQHPAYDKYCKIMSCLAILNQYNVSYEARLEKHQRLLSKLESNSQKTNRPGFCRL